MDAYSVSCTSLSRSNSSRRIYQDLKTVHFLNLAQLDPAQLEFSLRALNDTLEVAKSHTFFFFVYLYVRAIIRDSLDKCLALNIVL